MEHLTVSVNLSGLQLRDQLLLQRVSRAITGNGLPGSAVTLELTESDLRSDLEAASASYQALAAHRRALCGRRLWNGLLVARRSAALAVDVLKIDRSFASGILPARHLLSPLIAAMLALAHARGIETVAEGWETEEQAAQLRGLGCSAAQGLTCSQDRFAPVESSRSSPAIAEAAGVRHHHQVAG